MTTTRTDLLDLAASLRKALGTDATAEQPTVAPDWHERWPVLAELGVTAFCVSQECDGFGTEVAAALTTARELGAALHGGPYPALTAASYAVSRWLDGPDRDPLTAGIVAGQHLPTLAVLAPGATVTEHADGPRLDGRAHLVAGAEEADSYLALLPDRAAMLLVRRADTCTTVHRHDFDPTRGCADIAFAGAAAVPLAADADGRERVEALHGLLLAADALGGLGRMLDRTVAYARQRTAFGKAIGGFQAVQHRLVDHAVRLRGMSLLAEDAAARLTEDTPGAVRTARLAEASVAGGAVAMLHDLLQLTGAIGFTWEYGLHLYERRAQLDARLGRNPRQALHAVARHEGWTTA